MLFVRIFTNAIHLVSVQAGIEDEVDAVDHLALYNGDPKLKPGQALPKGAIFAIKEPFYKVPASGGYLVRVGEWQRLCARSPHLLTLLDHPSNAVKLPPSHELVPAALPPRLMELDESAATRKLECNGAYKTKDFLSAVQKYKQGLAECGEYEDQLKSDFLRNRSIANLYLHSYEPATADAVASITPGTELAMAVVENNAKAHYRAGCVLYHQEDFKEALRHFGQSLDLLPEDKDCQREIKRTEDRRR